MKTTYSDEDLKGLWNSFFSKNEYQKKIADLASNWPQKRSLDIDFRELYSFGTDLIGPRDFATYLVQHPREVLEAGGKMAGEMTKGRVTSVPLRLYNREPNATPDKITAEYAGRLLTFDGLVVSSSNVRPRIIDAHYECLRCHHIIEIRADHPDSKKMPTPIECDKNQGGCGIMVPRTKFRLLADQSKFVDTQTAMIVDRQSRKGISCQLSGDTVGQLEIGQNVRITGIGSIIIPERVDWKLSYYISVNSIEDARNSTVKEIDKPVDLRSTIAPGLSGLDHVKEIIELQLFGGVPHKGHDHYVRGDINVLLLGPKDTGKTTLLESAVALSPIGSYVDAAESGMKGLIGEIIESRYGNIAKGGELTLSTGGLIAVDNIDTLDDVRPLQEPLERQTAIVTGYGEKRTLNARCSILAAGNAGKDKFPEPFLDRFDYVFELKKYDRSNRREPSLKVLNAAKDYVLYARTLKPELSDDAVKLLDSIKGGWRQQNKIQRMAEAKAKKELRTDVNTEEIEYAQKIIEKTTS